MESIKRDIESLARQTYLLNRAGEQAYAIATQQLESAFINFERYVAGDVPSRFPVVQYRNGRRVITQWEFESWFNPPNCDPSDPRPSPSDGKRFRQWVLRRRRAIPGMPVKHTDKSDEEYEVRIVRWLSQQPGGKELLALNGVADPDTLGDADLQKRLEQLKNDPPSAASQSSKKLTEVQLVDLMADKIAQSLMPILDKLKSSVVDVADVLTEAKYVGIETTNATTPLVAFLSRNIPGPMARYAENENMSDEDIVTAQPPNIRAALLLRRFLVGSVPVPPDEWAKEMALFVKAHPAVLSRT